MHRSYKMVLVFLLVVRTGINAQDTTRVSRLAESFLRQTKLPGLSLAVAQKGQMIYRKGFGYSNVEDQLPMLPSTRIRTASVAKVMTATALGRLATEGLLDFDEPIETYVPYIKKAYANLTVRQLAGHTSGLAHRPRGRGYDKKQYRTIRETLDIMDAPLLFEPGTDYQYSTAAFNLLGAVIEGASGLSYHEYMETQVFGPLDMKDTAPEDIYGLTARDANIYHFKNGKLKKDKPNNGSYKVPGAAFRSTSGNLVKLMKAYGPGGFISEEVARAMFESNRLENGKKTQVGIAWRSSVDIFGNKIMEHAGSWRGARTVLVYYPEQDLSIGLMVNAECQLLIEETAHIFAQCFLNGKGPSQMTDRDKKIIVTHNSKEGQIRYNGILELDKGLGSLTVESDTYLKANEVIQLPKGFALSTFYGLLFMEINTVPSLEGRVYAYRTMNARNPKEGKSLLEFKALE